MLTELACQDDQFSLISPTDIANCIDNLFHNHWAYSQSLAPEKKKGEVLLLLWHPNHFVYQCPTCMKSSHSLGESITIFIFHSEHSNKALRVWLYPLSPDCVQSHWLRNLPTQQHLSHGQVLWWLTHQDWYYYHVHKTPLTPSHDYCGLDEIILKYLYPLTLVPSALDQLCFPQIIMN